MNNLNATPQQDGRISVHDGGLGEANLDAIESRARELASIDGLPPREVTDEYRTRARRELEGHDESDTATDDAPEVAGLTEFDDAPGDHGHSAPNVGARADEMSVGEALYGSGVAEAEHDRMVESRRSERAAER